MSFYISDLDGTLLDQQGRLAPSTRTGLLQLLDEGLTFTVASARHVSSIRQILGDLPLRLPVISSNGAYISEMATGRHELVHSIDPALARAVFALIRQHGLMPFISTHGPKGDQLFYQSVHNEAQQAFVDERLRNADPRLRRSTRLQDELTDPAVTFVVVEREAPLAALQAAIDELCGDAVETHLAEDLYKPGWPWLTVHDRRATKDQAIKTVAERYGLAEREVVVFGDHVNDIKMLRAAHRGIAVANAIAAVKDEAHQVIGPHHEDAVLRFIDADWKR
ncbi:HAD family hydrolase [Roseateles oligotrophus]|uniref:Cof-type HAD-IIB family hydrolase n=1 Tax=Roseateles oligotrophus TaxID=1769250 RepID=A0ABT2Y9C0_9BURK|nr:HAD family hydrolase [Roseateles oligotrophus]MCV2366878.1 Cof-type HAD-IIB family hydrolase [Roseateles oligotrophus]